jgi:hypothetical protein
MRIWTVMMRGTDPDAFAMCMRGPWLAWRIPGQVFYTRVGARSAVNKDHDLFLGMTIIIHRRTGPDRPQPTTSLAHAIVDASQWNWRRALVSLFPKPCSVAEQPI